MAFCTQCGRPFQAKAPIDDISSSATIAMESDETTQPRRPYTTATSNTAPPPQSPPPARKSRLGLVIGAAAGFFLLGAFLLVAVVGGYLYFRRAQGPDMPPANNAPNSNARFLTNTAGNNNTGANTAANANRASTPAPSPDVSFAPPVEPTKSGTFTVYANGGWQVSDLETVALEEFTTRASGLVDISGIKSNVGPKGVTDAASKSRRLIADFPTGALLMRTRYADGKFSNVQPVSASPSNGNWRNFPDERGRLEFCVNDNAGENNGGQFLVTLKMTRVPKAKK